MSEVKRYKAGLNGTAFMSMMECHETHHGPEYAPNSYEPFVTASDYDLLAAQLARARNLLEQLLDNTDSEVAFSEARSFLKEIGP